jgi:hypothetical protein
VLGSSRLALVSLRPVPVPSRPALAEWERSALPADRSACWLQYTARPSSIRRSARLRECRRACRVCCTVHRFGTPRTSGLRRTLGALDLCSPDPVHTRRRRRRRHRRRAAWGRSRACSRRARGSDGPADRRCRSGRSRNRSGSRRSALRAGRRPHLRNPERSGTPRTCVYPDCSSDGRACNGRRCDTRRSVHPDRRQECAARCNRRRRCIAHRAGARCCNAPRVARRSRSSLCSRARTRRAIRCSSGRGRTRRQSCTPRTDCRRRRGGRGRSRRRASTARKCRARRSSDLSGNRSGSGTRRRG